MNLETLFLINYGMYVVSSVKDLKYNGQIANTVFQVTAEPPAISICLNKNNLTCSQVLDTGRFAVSILDVDTPMTLIGRFGFKSGKDIEKFNNEIKWEKINGLPILIENVTGYVICEMTHQLDVGTHILIVGKVIEAEKLSDKKPMTYSYYHEIKRGKSPPSAPTYLKKI